MTDQSPKPPTTVWTDERIREAFIYDGGEAEYHDPISGAQTQRQVAGSIFDAWLAAHDAALLATLSTPPADDVRPWRPEDGDTRCQQCGHRNPIWWADNAQWNATVGGPDATDDPGGVLCPTCYHAKWLGREERPVTPPVDDVREAAEAAAEAKYPMGVSSMGWSYEDAAEYTGRHEGFIEGFLAAAEVRPRGAVTDAKVDAAQRVLDAHLGVGHKSITRAALEAAWNAQP